VYSEAHVLSIEGIFSWKSVYWTHPGRGYLVRRRIIGYASYVSYSSGRGRTLMVVLAPITRGPLSIELIRGPRVCILSLRSSSGCSTVRLAGKPSFLVPTSEETVRNMPSFARESGLMDTFPVTASV
jgi:hypothetical protein